jgi:hypothetical protein
MIEILYCQIEERLTQTDCAEIILCYPIKELPIVHGLNGGQMIPNFTCITNAATIAKVMFDFILLLGRYYILP